MNFRLCLKIITFIKTDFYVLKVTNWLPGGLDQKLFNDLNIYFVVQVYIFTILAVIT